MNGLQRRLPAFTLEDELATLRGLIVIGWAGLILMVLLELLMRMAPGMQWPQLGGFSASYNLILLEFSANNLVLTALLLRRDWYERIPRESQHRVRWLLNAVLVWVGLHYFAVFHVTGSLSSPLLPLLPVMLIGVLLVFPDYRGWSLVAYLLAGHAGVLLLEQSDIVERHGQLSRVFSLAAPATAPGWMAVLAGLAMTLALSGLVRRRLAEAGASIFQPSRIDPATGLYRQEFLRQRLARELGRARRYSSATALLLLDLERTGEHSAPGQAEAAHELKRAAAQSLIENVRLSMDTPTTAYLLPATFAVLLPATDAEGARVVARRCVDTISRLPSPADRPLRLRCGVAVVADASGVVVSKVMTAAAEALAAARAAGSDLEIVEVTR